MKKKSKLERFTPLLLGTCLLGLVAACGSDDDDSGSGTTRQEERQDGTYRVVFRPVNPGVEGLANAEGTGEFTINGDEFRARINVTGLPDAEHMQHVHIGTRCAEPSDDNGDGIIDIVDSANISGGALIPLDNDLSSQSAGGNYPTGVEYNYEQSTSYLAMLADLRLPDDNENDIIVKLGPDAELDLEGKVVEIHGIPADTVLPGTVRGIDGMTPQQTLPVLCGIITRDDTGSTTGDTGTTTGDTGSTSGDTGSTTGDAGSTTGDTGSTTGDTGATTGDTGATTGLFGN